MALRSGRVGGLVGEAGSLEGMPANLFRRGATWYARFFVAGQLQRLSLQTSDLREAKIRLKGLRKKAERQAFGVTGSATWNEAVTAYASGVLDSGTLKASTAKRYRVSLRQIDAAFAGRALPDLVSSDIAGYVMTRQQAGATNATIRRDLTTISRVLAFARSHGMVERNVADDYDRSLLRERRAPIEIPAEDVILAGSEAADAAGLPELGTLILFLRATGLRAGEALRARWSDVRGRSLTIHETKAGRVRTIGLGDARLPRRPGSASDQDRLFPTLPLDTGALASRWQWVKRGVLRDRHFRLHDLRHAYAIAELRRGRDIYDLARHLGHSSVKVTEIYLGYVPGGRPLAREQVTHEMTHRPRRRAIRKGNEDA